MAAVVQRIDLNLPEFDYASDDIELQAGTQFFFTLCPRNRTGNQLDDQIDGQDFQVFCTASIPFTTQRSSPPPGPRPKPPAPSISAIEFRQATLTESGAIVIRWVATTVFDQYHVISQELPSGGPIEVEIDSAGVTGFSYSHSQFSGTLLQLQGARLHNSPDRVETIRSSFTAPTIVQVPRNTHSLRAFLTLSRVRLTPGLRSLDAAPTSA